MPSASVLFSMRNAQHGLPLVGNKTWCCAKLVSSNLQDALMQFLLDVPNNSWLSWTFPSEWLLAVTIPIPKPGKNQTLTSSYRPVSFVSNINKVFEHVIQDRLTWWLECKYCTYHPTCLVFALTRAHLMLCSSWSITSRKDLIPQNSV